MFKGSLHDTSDVKIADLTEITPLKGPLVEMATTRTHGSQYVRRIPRYEDAGFSVEGIASEKICPGKKVKLKSGDELDTDPYTVKSITPSDDESMSFSAELKRTPKA